MNKRMVEGINQYMDEIIERWQVQMKEEKGERFFISCLLTSSKRQAGNLRN